MPRMITMTESLARTIAREAGNRRMRQGGRREWDEEDWNFACAQYEMAMAVGVGKEFAEVEMDPRPISLAIPYGMTPKVPEGVTMSADEAQRVMDAYHATVGPIPSHHRQCPVCNREGTFGELCEGCRHDFSELGVRQCH